MKEAELENIMRWLPFDADPVDIRNRLRNKMIRPTTIPQTLEDLIIEHAVAREALRLGFAHHKYLARPLRGVQRTMDIGHVFDQQTFVTSYINMMNVGWVAGTGGLLSHAPRRAQTAFMLMDGFQPEGITRLAQDSVFMMPHLGVLSTVHPKAALEIFETDCLVRVATCIAPRGIPPKDPDAEIFSVKAEMPDGTIVEEAVTYGTVKRIPLLENESANVKIVPQRGFDVGGGSGNQIEGTVDGGVVGIILDGRGRPLVLPEAPEERRRKLLEWFKALDAYPKELFQMT
jgi:hypothetical protein